MTRRSRFVCTRDVLRSALSAEHYLEYVESALISAHVVRETSPLAPLERVPWEDRPDREDGRDRSVLRASS